jgi:hypothetical protein
MPMTISIQCTKQYSICEAKRRREGEEMYQRALAGNAKVQGPDHVFILDIVNNLSTLYFGQGKLK